MKQIMTSFLLFLAIFSCSDDPAPVIDSGPTTVTYVESNEDFPNPERGFYRYSETRASSYSALSESTLKNYRTPKTPSGGAYSIYSTLVFRYFVLDSFKDTPLSTTFLNNVKADFTIARNAGVKLVVRFTYTVTATASTCSEGFICPPYGDAPKNIVLGHIAQLGPILTENADVIACVQMGFIGTWGEQYYTDYFGDASSNSQGKLFDNNWQDRIDVLKALLDATPKSVMIQVRYPQIKQRYVYGINALVNSAALSEAEGFTDIDKARIAYHNDCFLASSDDFGTYEDYGNSSSPRITANTTLRNYFAVDSKYLVVGGETCSDGYSPQNDCEPTGRAEKEMKDMHYSFLNADYNNQVNNDWVTGNCMENIKKKLGYRFVLKTGTYPVTIATGEDLSVSLSVENVGYASPYKSKQVKLVLRNALNNDEHSFMFDTDARKWFTGSFSLEGTFNISSLPKGEYALFLHVADASPALANRFEYSIRFANDNVWEESTGYNALNHTLRLE
jgi:hypothetical protein